MKTDLVANIIAAHCSGDEGSFKAAVDALAADELNKGNSRTSTVILEAYTGKTPTPLKKPDAAAPPPLVLPLNLPLEASPLRLPSEEHMPRGIRTAFWNCTT